MLYHWTLIIEVLVLFLHFELHRLCFVWLLRELLSEKEKRNEEIEQLYSISLLIIFLGTLKNSF
jgi:hypothetical protein